MSTRHVYAASVLCTVRSRNALLDLRKLKLSRLRDQLSTGTPRPNVASTCLSVQRGKLDYSSAAYAVHAAGDGSLLRKGATLQMMDPIFG